VDWGRIGLAPTRRMMDTEPAAILLHRIILTIGLIQIINFPK